MATKGFFANEKTDRDRWEKKGSRESVLSVNFDNDDSGDDKNIFSGDLFSLYKKVKLATIVERLSFQQLLNGGVGKDATPLPGWLHFTLDTYFIKLSVKQVGIKYYF